VNQPDDDLLADLARLPARDADPTTADRVLRAATSAMAAPPPMAFALRAARALGPLVLAGTVGIYLTWAVSAANALFQ
jgi:hypothetical protein